jgi:(2Fe-2S) ferredoxin
MKSALRPLPDEVSGKPLLTVCVNDRGPDAIIASCGHRGGAVLENALGAEIARRGLDIELQTIKCLGLCEKGPNVRLAPGINWFHEVSSDDVTELVDQAVAHMNLSG